MKLRHALKALIHLAFDVGDDRILPCMPKLLLIDHSAKGGGAGAEYNVVEKLLMGSHVSPSGLSSEYDRDPVAYATGKGYDARRAKTNSKSARRQTLNVIAVMRQMRQSQLVDEAFSRTIIAGTSATAQGFQAC